MIQKWQSLIFAKKSPGLQIKENSKLWGIFEDFFPYLLIQSLTFFEFSYFKLSSTLCNSSRKQYVIKKSSPRPLPGTRLPFLDIFSMFIPYDSSDVDVWRNWSLDRLYCVFGLCRPIIYKPDDLFQFFAEFASPP